MAANPISRNPEPSEAKRDAWIERGSFCAAVVLVALLVAGVCWAIEWEIRGLPDTRSIMSLVTDILTVILPVGAVAAAAGIVIFTLAAIRRHRTRSD